MDTLLPFVIGVVLIALGLALSIGLHEIGHLVPAKLFRVKVTQYMIGFGPTLFSRKRGETEYGVKAIPLGGYIAMSGMFPPAKDGTERTGSTGFFQGLIQDARTASAESVTPGDENRVFYRLPVWKRVIIMLGGPLMNLVLAVVLLGILVTGFGIPQTSTTIGSVSACVLPASSSQQTCQPGDAAAPGAAAGLVPGDRIVSINGEEITTWQQSTDIIRASAGVPLAITIERGGQTQQVTVTPLLTERNQVDQNGKVITDADGKPVTAQYGFIGIGGATERVQQPPTAVLPMVGQSVAGVTGIVLNLPQRLVDVANAAFGPGERDPNGPMSVVGVGRVAGEIASLDSVPVIDKATGLIGILASLNIALFVFNLIPLLPLDGGHIAGALWEGLRRSFAKVFRRRDPGPVDTAKLMPLSFAVVILLGSMSALLIYADIVKPISVL